MRNFVIVFVFIYSAIMASTPMVNYCLCKHDLPGCEHNKIADYTEIPMSCCSEPVNHNTPKIPANHCGSASIPKSCCSETAGNNANDSKTKMPDTGCNGASKGACCLKCVNSTYALNRGVTIIVTPEYSSFDYLPDQGESFANITSPDRILSMNRPPGGINLSSHIKSTVIRC